MRAEQFYFVLDAVLFRDVRDYPLVPLVVVPHEPELEIGDSLPLKEPAAGVDEGVLPLAVIDGTRAHEDILALVGKNLFVRLIEGVGVDSVVDNFHLFGGENLFVFFIQRLGDGDDFVRFAYQCIAKFAVVYSPLLVFFQKFAQVPHDGRVRNLPRQRRNVGVRRVDVDDIDFFPLNQFDELRDGALVLLLFLRLSAMLLRRQLAVALDYPIIRIDKSVADVQFVQERGAVAVPRRQNGERLDAVFLV